MQWYITIYWGDCILPCTYWNWELQKTWGDAVSITCNSSTYIVALSYKSSRILYLHTNHQNMLRPLLDILRLVQPIILLILLQLNKIPNDRVTWLLQHQFHQMQESRLGNLQNANLYILHYIHVHSQTNVKNKFNFYTDSHN